MNNIPKKWTFDYTLVSEGKVKKVLEVEESFPTYYNLLDISRQCLYESFTLDRYQIYGRMISTSWLNIQLSTIIRITTNPNIKTQEQEIETQRQEIETQRQEIKTQRQEIKTQRQEIETQRQEIETQEQEIETQRQEIKTNHEKFDNLEWFNEQKQKVKNWIRELGNKNDPNSYIGKQQKLTDDWKAQNYAQKLSEIKKSAKEWLGDKSLKPWISVPKENTLPTYPYPKSDISEEVINKLDEPCRNYVFSFKATKEMTKLPIQVIHPRELTFDKNSNIFERISSPGSIPKVSIYPLSNEFVNPIYLNKELVLGLKEKPQLNNLHSFDLFKYEETFQIIEPLGENDLIKEPIFIPKTKDQETQTDSSIPTSVPTPPPTTDGFNWENIHSDFKNAPNLKQGWMNNGFTHEQVRDWINVGLFPNAYNFCVWLRDIKKLTPEEFLNFGDIEELDSEFANYEKERGDEVAKELSDYTDEELVAEINKRMSSYDEIEQTLKSVSEGSTESVLEQIKRMKKEYEELKAKIMELE